MQKISCYTSKDLLHWKFDKYVITPQTDPAVARSHLERPKVVFNDKTHQFVLWVHRESLMGYADAQCAVASCDTVDGNYTWHGSFRPNGNMSRDSTLFKDDDGRAYFISSSNENADMMVYLLSDDYLKVKSQIGLLFRGAISGSALRLQTQRDLLSGDVFLHRHLPQPQLLCDRDVHERAVVRNETAVRRGHLHDVRLTGGVYPDGAGNGDDVIHLLWRSMGGRSHAPHLVAAAIHGRRGDQTHGVGRQLVDRCRDGASHPSRGIRAVARRPGPGAVVTSDYNYRGEMDETNFSHLAGCEPSNANDGDLTTWWCARDNLPGHWWQVDLGAPTHISGTQIIWHRRNGAYHYAIDVSPDGQHWMRKVNSVGKRGASGRNAPLPAADDSFSAEGVRYVRVTILSTPSGYDWPGFAECRVLSKGVDIARGKPASADSWQPNTDCTKAVDGDISTAWSIDDATPGHWIKVDLGKTVDIGACRILWDAAGFYHQYKIETSADDQHWTMAVDMTKNTTAVRMPLHKFVAPAARYLRITVTDAEFLCWPAIRDLEILSVDGLARAQQAEAPAPAVR